MPGSDDVMNIGPKTLRESPDIDIGLRAFHQWVSGVGELTTAPSSTARAMRLYVRKRKYLGLG